jgi:hypothetical protein
MGNQSLELPRETLEEPAGVELGRHRASPRRDGADDAAQVHCSAHVQSHRSDLGS